MADKVNTVTLNKATNGFVIQFTEGGQGIVLVSHEWGDVISKLEEIFNIKRPRNMTTPLRAPIDLASLD